MSSHRQETAEGCQLCILNDQPLHNPGSSLVILAYPQVLENKSLHVLSYSKLNNEKASEKGERWIAIKFKVCHVAVKAEEKK